MKVLASAYNDHPIRPLISRILELQGLPVFAEPSISENAQLLLARDKSFAITRAIEALIEQTPQELISGHALNVIQGQLQQPLNELNAYVANKNPGHISNAAAQFEQNILPLLWGFAPQIQKLPLNSLTRLMSAQAAVSQESIKQLSMQRDELSIAMANLTKDIAAQAERLDAVTSGAAAERAEAAATVAKLEQAFTQSEGQRASTFETTVAELSKNFLAFENSSKNASAALITDLEIQKTQAARIVQIVGNIGVTGNYQQIADAESKQANFWRWVTVAIFAFGISVAGATFLKFWGEAFSSENAISVGIRLLYAIAITAPAWYTARESARHRTNSDRARQTELELASIGPFIELMPEDKKIQIREQLTPIYFGKTVDAHTTSSPLDVNSIKDLVIELVKTLKK